MCTCTLGTIIVCETPSSHLYQNLKAALIMSWFLVDQKDKFHFLFKMEWELDSRGSYTFAS